MLQCAQKRALGRFIPPHVWHGVPDAMEAPQYPQKWASERMLAPHCGQVGIGFSLYTNVSWTASSAVIERGTGMNNRAFG